MGEAADGAWRDDPAPLVSVVLPTHNRADTLPRALACVLAQDHRHLDIVVVDDGSTDDTAAVVARLADPRIRYLVTPAGGRPRRAQPRHRGGASPPRRLPGQRRRMVADQALRQIAALRAMPGAPLAYCALDQRYDAFRATVPRPPHPPYRRQYPAVAGARQLRQYPDDAGGAAAAGGRRLRPRAAAVAGLGPRAPAGAARSRSPSCPSRWRSRTTPATSPPTR
ncbi:glycosyltransferase family 2 protein [Sphingomonas sp. MMS24-JH45]